MKISFSVVAIAFAVLGLAIGANTQDKDKPETHKNVRTIKGCLDKTDDAKEFALTGTDGSTWEIRSDSVNLDKHVGHTVSVTGAVSNAAMHGAKEDAKNEAKEHGIDKNATEHGHMTVTNLKMVSDSCGK